MIRINLLPVREARRKADLQQQALVAAGALAASVVLCAVVHGVMIARVSGAENRVAGMSQQIEQFKPQLAQVEEFRKKKADVQQKLDVIQRLDKSRSGPVHVLDELVTRSPERLWLTSLDAAKGTVVLKGMSLDNESIAQLLTALNDSDYFERVELDETELAERGGFKLNAFKLHATLTVPGVDDAAPEPARPAAAPAGKKAPAAKPAAAATR